MRSLIIAGAFAVLACTSVHAQAHRPFQYKPGEHRSSNVKVLGHLPLPGLKFSHADVEVEQELSRPYAYVSHREQDSGFEIISIADPAKPKVIYRWVIENAPLHLGAGGLANMYVKIGSRYYYLQSYQFKQGGPDADLAFNVFDVTSLPDVSKIREVARVRIPEAPGGVHEMFAYKHSDGRALLVATTVSPDAYIYDIAKVVSGDLKNALVGKVTNPSNGGGARSWHDFYVGYDPATHQDKLYAAGAGGCFVFDITNVAAPSLIASLTAAGVTACHTFVPTPDGRFALAEPLPTYQYAPVRVFDIKPALDGKVKAIGQPIGAWAVKWNGAPHNFEMRWPYAFISAQDDGIQIVNMMDPTNPHTIAYYNTREGCELCGEDVGGAIGNGGGIYQGAWGVDVRNADGLIVSSDFNSGFWTLKLEGFDGWNGRDWGVPNNSSAQDWDNGPDGTANRGKSVT